VPKGGHLHTGEIADKIEFSVGGRNFLRHW
jgi:hypothetical protein